MEVKTFGVVGAGQMGNGIAQVAAHERPAGHHERYQDEFVAARAQKYHQHPDRNVEKGKMSAEEKDAVLGRIKTSVQLKDMAGRRLTWWRLQPRTKPSNLQIFQRARCHLPATRHPCHQYLFHSHRQDRSADQTS